MSGRTNGGAFPTRRRASSVHGTGVSTPTTLLREPARALPRPSGGFGPPPPQPYRSLDIVSGYGAAILALMGPEPVREFIISGHARFEMERRGISDEVVRQVVESPEQQFQTRKGRVVLHSRMLLGTPATMYLVRVVVDVDRRPAEVVTVYRTTKLGKYWREEP